MYIQPNSTVKLLTNVPLTNKYRDTIYFKTANEQFSFFNSKSFIDFNNLTYVRLNKGEIRVNEKADNLYSCNYLMYRNTAYGSKWFYAFITSIEYVNDGMSIVKFEIDVMQTWLFELTLEECFIERQHSITDNAGDNVVEENIDIGNIICNNMQGTNLFNSYVAVIASCDNSDGSVGGYRGGLFSGVNYIPALVDTKEDVTKLVEYLNSAIDANKADSIINITMYPSAFFTTDENVKVQVTKVQKNSKLGNYIPRNKKLLTFPYNYLIVDSGNNSAVYRYEYFKSGEGVENNECGFTMYGTATGTPQVLFIPNYYNGADFNYSERLLMDGFPQCAFAVDSYRAYVAQHPFSQFISSSQTAVTAASSFATGGVGAVMGTIGLASQVSSIIDSVRQPPQTKGIDSGSIDVASRTKNFYFKQMMVTEQYAKIIDDYFDMYGYATKRTGIPNRNSRPHWNYVKTRGVHLRGNAPADDVSRICDIYDSGITFWNNGNNVGNYSLDNSPT